MNAEASLQLMIAGAPDLDFLRPWPMHSVRCAFLAGSPFN
jgi:hypothetical protein